MEDRHAKTSQKLQKYIGGLELIFHTDPLGVFEEASEISGDFEKKYFLIWQASKYQKLGMYKEA